MQNDNVKHPSHYTRYGVEVIEITKALPFCLGNVVKYVLRAPFKNGVEDCKKALQYLKWCDRRAVQMGYSIACAWKKAVDKYRYELLLENRVNNPVARQQARFLKQLQDCIWQGCYTSLRFFVEEMQKILENKMLKLPGLIINAYSIRSIQPGMETDFFGGNKVYMIVFKMIDGTKEVFKTRSREVFDRVYEYTKVNLGVK